ncbi:hypothetical protein AC579_3944 [Pseudocercospora musae]|uniref:Uncharacterized protein n=1 Tax=Pseudocercospora musae TaxID=113226 RepID=A0A139IKN6_9PEZI|nr:hypothetical protein AC579_3944 [Pseudocercospora musae]KXT15196.1 hypothetical protein AC579_3944 [Pseudocercospora musae]KXT15197.1 hypothetical protein AC579_3944 [Pseudocercospora musae]
MYRQTSLTTLEDSTSTSLPRTAYNAGSIGRNVVFALKILSLWREKFMGRAHSDKSCIPALWCYIDQQELGAILRQRSRPRQRRRPEAMPDQRRIRWNVSQYSRPVDASIDNSWRADRSYPPPDRYEANDLVADHFAMTPALMDVGVVYGKSVRSRGSRSHGTWYRISHVVERRMRQVARHHGLLRQDRVGLCIAGSADEMQDFHRERIMLLVLELSPRDLHRWYEVHPELIQILKDFELDGDDGVCIRYYRRAGRGAANTENIANHIRLGRALSPLSATASPQPEPLVPQPSIPRSIQQRMSIPRLPWDRRPTLFPLRPTTSRFFPTNSATTNNASLSSLLAEPDAQSERFLPASPARSRWRTSSPRSNAATGSLTWSGHDTVDDDESLPPPITYGLERSSSLLTAWQTQTAADSSEFEQSTSDGLSDGDGNEAMPSRFAGSDIDFGVGSVEFLEDTDDIIEMRKEKGSTALPRDPEPITRFEAVYHPVAERAQDPPLTYESFLSSFQKIKRNRQLHRTDIWQVKNRRSLQELINKQTRPEWQAERRAEAARTQERIRDFRDKYPDARDWQVDSPILRRWWPLEDALERIREQDAN